MAPLPSLRIVGFLEIFLSAERGMVVPMAREAGGKIAKKGHNRFSE